MSPALRFVPCLALVALSGVASAQALILPPDPREDTERRLLLDQLRRVASATSAILTNYVDVLDEAPLAARCSGGMESWLAAGRISLPAPERAPVKPVERIGEMLVRASRVQPAVNLEKMADACIGRMLEGLDSRSSHLDRESFRELQVGGAGLGGIGLEMQREGDYTKIVSTIDDAPGVRAGLRAGDLILSVDGVSIKGISLGDVVKLTRGKVGARIVLMISRSGEAAPLRFEILRQAIRIQSVRASLLEGRLLYVRISQFQEATHDRLLALLREEGAKVPEGFAGVILDLRNNPGGLLNSCIAIAAVFLPETAVVVEMRGRTPDNNRKMYARPAGSLRAVPLAVLVNRQSAACSEILAAAMQDHQRAKVIGEKTFGVGTVQTILPTGGADALRLTTSRYYRPSGAAMEGNPVIPDVAIDFGGALIPYGTAADPGLAAARKALETPP